MLPIHVSVVVALHFGFMYIDIKPMNLNFVC